MDERRCGYCFGPLRLVREGAEFCSQRCGTYYRRRSLPRELTSRAKWIRHDARKRPLSARTGRLVDVTDPREWSTYREAKESPHGVGLGFVLSDDDDIACVDLDGVLTDQGVPVDVRRLIESTPDRFMVERSFSGRGLHVWFRTSERLGSNRVEGGIRVERYSRARYIAATGLRLGL